MDRELWLEARAIAERRGLDGEGRKDLAQDLMVAALERGAGVERVGAWLERVGRNAVIDRWRVERRREELADVVERPAAVADPEAALLARERRRLVRGAVGALSKAQRRVAVLRFHGELPFEQVAARLGTEVATARTRLHRALGALRGKLGNLRAYLPGWPGASLWPAAQAGALSLALLGAEAAAPPPVTISALSAEQTAIRLRGLARARVIAVEQPDERPSRTAAEAPPTPRVFVFGDDLVSGDVVGPEGERVQLVAPATHSSLIELRRHFLPEMVKSLEDL